MRERERERERERGKYREFLKERERKKRPGAVGVGAHRSLFGAPPLIFQLPLPCYPLGLEFD